MLSERLSKVILGLWYPAVLGSLLVVLLDHWAENPTAWQTARFWYGLLFVMYHTVLYAESHATFGHHENYEIRAFASHVIGMIAMYTGFLWLGLALDGRHESSTLFPVALATITVAPIILRKREEFRQSLNILASMAFALTAIAATTDQVENPVVVGGFWALLLGYVAVVSERARTLPPFEHLVVDVDGDGDS